MIYHLLTLSIVLISFLDSVKFSYKKYFYYLVMIGLSIFAGYRILPYVNDYKEYSEFFLKLNDFNDIKNSNFEIGYGIITYLIKSFTKNVHHYFFIISLFCLSTKFRFIRRYSSFCFFSIFIYYINLYMGLDLISIRQSIALTFILLAIDQGMSKKRINYVFFIIVASLIHNSALVFLPCYFIINMNLNKSKILILILLSIILGKLGVINYILNILIKHVGNFYPFLWKINHYLNMNQTESIISFGLIKKLVVVGLFLKYKEKIIKDGFNKFFNLVFLGYCLYFITSSLPWLQKRIGLYFDFFEVILIPSFFLINYSLRNRVLIYIFFICFNVPKYLIFTISFYDYLNPYKNYLFSLF